MLASASGSVLLTTKAAPWLATWISGAFGLQTASAMVILATLSAFLIIIHLGFASATGLAAAMIPIVILLQSVKTPGIGCGRHDHDPAIRGQFCMIPPVNAPQNMVAYATDTFEVRDFVRTGIPLTILGVPARFADGCDLTGMARLYGRIAFCPTGGPFDVVACPPPRSRLPTPCILLFYSLHVPSVAGAGFV